MKKILFLGLVVLLFVLVFNLFFDGNDQGEKNPVLGDSQPKKKDLSLTLTDEYEALWYQVEDLDKLILKSNLEEKEAASNLFASNSCSFLINGGFYSTDFKHIGLFLVEGNTLSPSQDNSLLNAFLSVNSLGTAKIGILPDEDLRFALQTGPLLVSNGQYKKLSLRSDKYARRSVAMVTGSNDLIFMMLYSGESHFSGPLLSEVTYLIQIFSQKININIADAINLDGGKASAFITKETVVTELSPIGSFFCVVE